MKKWNYRILLCIISGAVLLLSGCAKSQSREETAEASPSGEQVIPYPEERAAAALEAGASSFQNLLDAEESPYYVRRDYYDMESSGTLHLIPKFRTYQQTTEYSCGCAAALMVLDHYGIDQYEELEIAELAGTDTSKGTSVEGLQSFFESIGFETDAHAGEDYRFQDIEEAEQYFIDSIDAGIPVMLDWLDWRGHWVVLIGIDTMNDLSPYDDVLIFADSYDVTDHDQDGYDIYPLGRFFDMWREGVCAQKTVPYEQPFVKAWKE